MAKARYTVTTKGSITTIHRIGPPGEFPTARIVPLGSNGDGSAAEPRASTSRRQPKKKRRRSNG